VIGLCNKKADFERLTRVDDRLGGYREEWAAFKTGWPCRLQSARARAYSYLDKTEIDADGVVFCPYFAGLTELDRVRIDGRTFTIAQVDNWNEENSYLKLYVQEAKV
jgi:hypothetical protein